MKLISKILALTNLKRSEKKASLWIPFCIEANEVSTNNPALETPSEWKEVVTKYRRCGKSYTKERLMKVKLIAASARSDTPCFAFSGSGISLHDWAKEKGVKL